MNLPWSSALEDEGDLQVHPVGRHFAIRDVDLHFAHPGAFDLVQSFVGSLDTFRDRILEALTPLRIASSNPSFDDAMISVTFATDMLYLPVDRGRQATWLTMTDSGFARAPAVFGLLNTNRNTDRIEDRLDQPPF